MAGKPGSRLFLGLVLLAVGGALLLARMHVVDYGPAFLMAFGVALSLFGVFSRRLSPLVPGCILLGLGAGMYLGDRGVEGVGVVNWNVLGLGAGFLLLFVLALVLGLGSQWWALVVGAVLVAVGGLPGLKGVLDPQIVVAVRTYWPAALVVLGLYLVVRELVA